MWVSARLAPPVNMPDWAIEKQFADQNGVVL